LWAAFDGEGYGEFHDINKITMFAGTSSLKLLLTSCHLTLTGARLSRTANAPFPRMHVLLSATGKPNAAAGTDPVRAHVGAADSR
jgi:hypothetical protein